MDHQIEVHCKGQNQPDSGWFNNGTNSFMEIHTCLLIKALGNKASFVLINCAISFLLQFKHPLVENHLLIVRTRNQGPGIIGDKGSEFSLHCIKPTRVLGYLVIGSGLSRKGKGGEGQKRILGRGIEFVIWKGFGVMELV